MSKERMIAEMIDRGAATRTEAGEVYDAVLEAVTGDRKSVV